MIDTRGRKHVQNAFDNTAKFLKLIHLHPNVITTLAFILGIVSFGFLSFGYTIHALILLWISGLFDVLDGTVARLVGKTSNLGAYLDLVFDRLVECFIILGFYFFMPEFTLSYLIFFIGMMFNFTTFMLAGSLFKNTGNKSMHYDVGIVERTESFVFFSAMMIFPLYVPIILNVFNALMILTGIIRMSKIIKFSSKN